MKNFIILSNKSWHDELFNNLLKRPGEKWVRITTQEELNLDKLRGLEPEKIFIPHWSHIISSDIFLNFDCVVFHMTDLPFGRGGSPLQNLIVRGFSKTMLSALKVEEGIDTGDIYCKSELSLHGTANEIFIRSSDLIFSMIESIIDTRMKATPQVGEAVNFKRRKPEDGNLSVLKELDHWYDYIRMLDAPGYPKAHIDIGSFKLEFSRVSLDSKTELVADVRIIKK